MNQDKENLNERPILVFCLKKDYHGWIWPIFDRLRHPYLVDRIKLTREENGEIKLEIFGPHTKENQPHE